MVVDDNRKDEYEALEVHQMSFFYEDDKDQLVVTKYDATFVCNAAPCIFLCISVIP